MQDNRGTKRGGVIVIIDNWISIMPYKYDNNKRNNAITTNLDTKTMFIRRAEADILINTL